MNTLARSRPATRAEPEQTPNVLTLRAILAVAMAACGSVILVRVGAYGIRIETLPGLVLGVAMIALGMHRILLIWHVRRDAPR